MEGEQDRELEGAGPAGAAAATIARTPPTALAFVTSQLRRAGNAAFREKRYAGVLQVTQQPRLPPASRCSAI
jgi:hypothetical protein